MLMIIRTEFYLKIFGRIVGLNRWYCVGPKPWFSAYNSINIVEASNKILGNHKMHCGLADAQFPLVYTTLILFYQKFLRKCVIF